MTHIKYASHLEAKTTPTKSDPGLARCGVNMTCRPLTSQSPTRKSWRRSWWRASTPSPLTQTLSPIKTSGLRTSPMGRSGRWKCWNESLLRNVFQDLRKGLSPTFTSGKIKGMLELLEGGIDQMIDHLEEVTDKDTLVEVKVQKVICKKHVDIQTKAG